MSLETRLERLAAEMNRSFFQESSAATSFSFHGYMASVSGSRG